MTVSRRGAVPFLSLAAWRSRRAPPTSDLSSIAAGSNYASLLCADPPIVLGWTGRLFRFGSASALAPLFRRRRITFVLVAKGSLADDDEARELAGDALAFMASHPRHRFEWLCNIAEETDKLRALGLSAHTHNQNLFLREDVFRPLGRVEPVWDAIYNARLSPEKRNELAARLASVAFVAYRDPGEHDVAAFHEASRALARQVPGGRLLNRITADGCARLVPSQVNAAYARARTGLCLSPREGAMRVAVEYQMAGLPIVATPCRGGRDHHLDPQTWTIVPPEPGAIRDAVEAWKARPPPREWVRARTLARIAADRERFVSFVQALIEQEGGDASFAATFRAMHRNDRIERWVPMRDFASEVWSAVRGD